MGSMSGAVGQQSDNSLKRFLTANNLTPAQRRFRRLVVGIWAVVGYGAACVAIGINHWGEWAFRAGLAAVGVPILIVLFWFPVVWASLRWLVRVAYRCVVSQRTGTRSGAIELIGPLLGVVSSCALLCGVGFVSVSVLGPYVQDWRQGALRLESVTCQGFHEDWRIKQTRGGKRRDYVFTLTGAQSFERSYRIPVSEADGKSVRGQEPYVTVMEVCRAEGTEIGISVYQHTGIVVDAWKTN